MSKYIHNLSELFKFSTLPFNLDKSTHTFTQNNKINHKQKKPITISQFFKFITPLHQPSAILISLFFLLASSITTAMLPKLLGCIIDLKLINDLLKRQIIIFLVIILVNAAFFFLKEYSSRLLSQKIVQKLRIYTFNSFLGYQLQFFQKNGVGSLMTRLSNDVNLARTSSTDLLLSLISNCILFISNCCSLLLVVDREMTFVFLLVLPIYMYITILFSKNAKYLAKKYNKILAQSTNFIQQRFTNIMTITAFKREEYQIQQYNRYSKLAINNVKQAALLHSFYSSATTLLPKLGIILSIYFGSDKILNGQMSIGNLTTFLLVYEQLSSNALTVAKNIGKMISGTGSLSKLFKVLTYKSKIQVSKGKQIPQNIKQFNIEFKNVEFSYPKTQNIIFRNLNFKINSGQYIGIVGRSGSGKSSILKLLLRLYDPDQGSVLLNGTDIKQFSIQSYHNHIGYVSQQPTLYSGTIRDNILYGKIDASQQEISQAIKMAGINFVQQFPKRLNTKVGQGGKKLSGGQKQRISIARALIRKPKILIFDQATSALDAQTQLIVQKSIEQILQKKQQNKMTVIVIAHKLTTIKNTQKIVVFQKGEIVEQGTHSELMQNSGVGIYHNLVKNQMFLMREQNKQQKIKQDLLVPIIKDEKNEKRKGEFEEDEQQQEQQQGLQQQEQEQIEDEEQSNMNKVQIGYGKIQINEKMDDEREIIQQKIILKTLQNAII